MTTTPKLGLGFLLHIARQANSHADSSDSNQNIHFEIHSPKTGLQCILPGVWGLRPASLQCQLTEKHGGPTGARFVASTCVHRSLTPSQRALIAAGFLEYERGLAKARQIAAQNNNAARAVVEDFPQQASDAGKARDKAGERMHVSGRTVDDAAKSWRAAQ